MKIKNFTVLRLMMEESRIQKAPFVYLMETFEKVVKYSDLYDREKFIIIESLHGKSFAEIGDSIDLKKERIRQIYGKAMRRCAKWLLNYIDERKEIESLKNRIVILENENSSLKRDDSTPINPDLYAPLYNFDVSVRLLNVCKNADIRCPKDLADTPAYKIMQYRNVGKKVIREISDFLMEKFNIKWGYNE